MSLTVRVEASIDRFTHEDQGPKKGTIQALPCRLQRLGDASSNFSERFQTERQH